MSVRAPTRSPTKRLPWVWAEASGESRPLRRLCSDGTWTRGDPVPVATTATATVTGTTTLLRQPRLLRVQPTERFAYRDLRRHHHANPMAKRIAPTSPPPRPHQKSSGRRVRAAIAHSAIAT